MIEALRQAMATLDDGIVCAYLFGSHARGDARAASDVDVAMADPELIAKQLAFIETMVGDLRRLARPDEIVRDGGFQPEKRRSRLRSWQRIHSG